MARNKRLAKKQEIKTSDVETVKDMVSDSETKETEKVITDTEKPAAEEDMVKAEESVSSNKIPEKKEEAAESTAPEKTTKEKATVKKSPLKKQTSKKAPVKKEEKVVSEKKGSLKPALYIQYQEKEIEQQEILSRVKEVWVNSMGNKLKDIDTMNIYVKPEESKAFFVINQDITGSVDL